eukprot:TRINITY_DN48119_c0_g1_i1.p1 TRINITY_DN48119_c0_g1~~TRINITY_DN48119_c0_g1_i1.p1  ORF type:complete len:407 (-),score=68.33 TRINITY_DN48119_c0_g1_i1:395-1615(-)
MIDQSTSGGRNEPAALPTEGRSVFWRLPGRVRRATSETKQGSERHLAATRSMRWSLEEQQRRIARITARLATHQLEASEQASVASSEAKLQASWTEQQAQQAQYREDEKQRVAVERVGLALERCRSAAGVVEADLVNLRGHSSSSHLQHVTHQSSEQAVIKNMLLASQQSQSEVANVLSASLALQERQHEVQLQQGEQLASVDCLRVDIARALSDCQKAEIALVELRHGVDAQCQENQLERELNHASVRGLMNDMELQKARVDLVQANVAGHSDRLLSLEVQMTALLRTHERLVEKLGTNSGDLRRLETTVDALALNSSAHTMCHQTKAELRSSEGPTQHGELSAVGGCDSRNIAVHLQRELDREQELRAKDVAELRSELKEELSFHAASMVRDRRVDDARQNDQS